MKHITLKKLTTLTLIAVMLVATLTGCGKVARKSRKNFTGFYLKETTRGKFDQSVAFSVDRDGNVTYMLSRDMEHRAAAHSGYLEPTEEGADIYLQTQYRSNGNVEGGSSFAKYCPLHVHFSEDGKKLYLASDSSDFNAAVFEVVEEDYFWNYIRNYIPHYEFIIPGEGSVRSEAADEAAPEDAEAAPEAAPEAATEAPEAPEAATEAPEAPEAATEAEETATAAASLSNALSTLNLIDNPTLFEEDGMRFSFDGFKVDEYNYFFDANFKIRNENPDNKKLFIELNSISINGIVWTDNIGRLLRRDSGGLSLTEGAESGQEFSCYAHGMDCAKYEEQLAKINASLATTPLMTVGFDFDIKAGSNGEVRHVSRTLKTALYNEVALNKMLGETTTGLALEGENLAAQVFVRDDGYAVLVRNHGTVPVELMEATVCMNGSEIDRTLGHADTVYPSGGVIFNIPTTEEALRRQYEMGASKPLSLTVDFYSENEVATVELLR